MCQWCWGCRHDIYMLTADVACTACAQDVARAAVQVVQQAQGVSTGEAEAILKKMSDSNRIQKDVW